MDKSKKISTSFHWFHWLVVSLSIVLTVFAWRFSKNQVDEKVEIQFRREAEQVVELISERMQKYEDALWAGVSSIQAHGGDVDYRDWLVFANKLKIGKKYPGINGIGVIHQVLPHELPSYLRKQREIRPDYHIHPAHNEEEFFPITYIEPVATNMKAVGLDMAHETNRYTAAKKARDTGLAQITGPISLVQDAERTPGFLFYVPFYIDGPHESVENRQNFFTGMVYAPFVVKKLMQGALLKEKRNVGIKINDGDEVLYDEHDKSHPEYDPYPLHAEIKTMEMYGRTWNFDIRSTKLFKETVGNNQPQAILIGGIIIDALIILLFIALSRSNKHAVEYANTMNQELKAKAGHLEKSNRDLEQFSYLISHDLNSPLRGISNVLGFIEEDHGDKIDKDIKSNLDIINGLVARSQHLLKDLLTYSNFANNNINDKKDLIKLDEIVKDILETNSIDPSCVSVNFEPQEFYSSRLLVRTVLNNLIANSRKHGENENPSGLRICVSCEIFDEKQYLFKIKDNGPGIPKGKEEDVFQIFRQLEARGKIGGTGLGLALVKSIVVNKDCRVWVEHPEEGGVEFNFTWPRK